MATQKRASTGRIYYAQDNPKAVKKASARKQARRIMERKYDLYLHAFVLP